MPASFAASTRPPFACDTRPENAKRVSSPMRSSAASTDVAAKSDSPARLAVTPRNSRQPPSVTLADHATRSPLHRATPATRPSTTPELKPAKSAATVNSAASGASQPPSADHSTGALNRADADGTFISSRATRTALADASPPTNTFTAGKPASRAAASASTATLTPSPARRTAKPPRRSS